MAAILPFSPAATAAPAGEAAPRRPLLGELLVDGGRAGARRARGGAGPAGRAGPAARAHPRRQRAGVGRGARRGAVAAVGHRPDRPRAPARRTRRSSPASTPTAASSSRPCPGARSAAPGSSRSAVPRTPRRRWPPAAAAPRRSRWRWPSPRTIRRALTEAFAGRLRDDARARCPEAYQLPRLDRDAAPGGAPSSLAAAALAATAAAPLLVLQLLLGWALARQRDDDGAAAGRALRPRAQRRPRRADARRPAARRLQEAAARSRSSCRCCARRRWRSGCSRRWRRWTIRRRCSTSSWCSRPTTRSPARRSSAAALPPTIEVVTRPGRHAEDQAAGDELRAALLPRRHRRGLRRRGPARPRRRSARWCQHLQAAPPEVACVQGYLDFYNTGDNWLSRCFTLEYAIWFRVVLLGVQRLGPADPARRHHACSSGAACWSSSAAGTRTTSPRTPTSACGSPASATAAR